MLCPYIDALVRCIHSSTASRTGPSRSDVVQRNVKDMVRSICERVRLGRWSRGDMPTSPSVNRPDLLYLGQRPWNQLQVVVAQNVSQGLLWD